MTHVTQEFHGGASKTFFEPYGTFGASRAPILRQDYHYLQMDPNKLPLEPHHLGVHRLRPK
jgi:hypothetical protein